MGLISRVSSRTYRDSQKMSLNSKITKIQAVWRGYYTRKYIYEAQKEYSNIVSELNLDKTTAYSNKSEEKIIETEPKPATILGEISTVTLQETTNDQILENTNNNDDDNEENEEIDEIVTREQLLATREELRSELVWIQNAMRERIRFLQDKKSSKSKELQNSLSKSLLQS